MNNAGESRAAVNCCMAKRFGTKKKRGGTAPRPAMQNMLRNFAARNWGERQRVPWVTVERQVRLQVQRDYPDLSLAEVEIRVQRRMEHGRRPHA